MNTRIGRLACAPALVVFLGSLAAHAASARGLLEKFAAASTPPTELDSIAKELVAMKAVDDILATAVDLPPEGDRAERLARALARINTKESVAALRKMLYTSRYLTSDIPDWRAFLLRLDAASRQPQLDKYITSAVPAALTGQAHEDATGRGDDPRQRRVVARVLNRLIADPDLYQKVDRSRLDAGDEAIELLERRERYQKPMPGSSLTAIEIERLNRRILDAAYSGSLEPLDALPINRYNPSLVSAGFASLGSTDRPEAAEMLFTVQPLELRARLDHIASIAEVKSDEADIALAEYLRDEEATVSSHARGALIERFAKDSAAAASVMRMAVTELRGRNAESLSDHVVTNTLLVCASIPAEAVAAGLIAAALESTQQRVVMKALSLLEKRPELVLNAAVLDALSAAARGSDETARAKAILKLLRQARARDGMETALYYLEDPDIEVSSLAARVLRQLSGKNFGRSPRAWLAALNDNPDLLDGDSDADSGDAPDLEQNGRTERPVETEDSKSRTVTTAVGLASLAAIVIMALLSRKR
jgi:hypothetical protein